MPKASLSNGPEIGLQMGTIWYRTKQDMPGVETPDELDRCLTPHPAPHSLGHPHTTIQGLLVGTMTRPVMPKSLQFFLAWRPHVQQFVHNKSNLFHV